MSVRGAAAQAAMIEGIAAIIKALSPSVLSVRPTIAAAMFMDRTTTPLSQAAENIRTRTRRIIQTVITQRQTASRVSRLSNFANLS